MRNCQFLPMQIINFRKSSNLKSVKKHNRQFPNAQNNSEKMKLEIRNLIFFSAYLDDKSIIDISHGGRGYWSINYIGPQYFVNTFSHSYAQKSWVLLLCHD